MKTMQYRGPFSKPFTIKFKDNEKKKFIQIGVELGNSAPIELNMDAQIAINGIPYKINNNRILEWDNFSERSLVITPLKYLDEYTLIDIAYE